VEEVQALLALQQALIMVVLVAVLITTILPLVKGKQDKDSMAVAMTARLAATVLVVLVAAVPVMLVEMLHKI
jgi:nitrogen fixation/metabolism regulation signal transduction histidine kinase